ncbi:hypothetical protein [Streptomyces xiamenensis]|uniref:hypothetical protein n=1 Tax=Streptomyces xiamenensis TaxID=408015 RepID=UPI0035DC83D6
MNTGTPLVDRDKSPLIDADHDPVRIADALRRSPHITSAQGEPGDDKIYFTTAAGAGFRLILRDGAPTGDDPLPAPDLTEAVAAAILNARDFVAAAPDSPRGGTITVQTRGGISYLLILDYCGTDSTAVDLPSPSAGIALAAGRLLTGSPSPFQRAT